MGPEIVVLKRDELYQAVWNEPVQTLAVRYGISGPALAKICRKLHVPVPPRGYWAKAAAGSARKRPPLPPLREGQPSKHIIHAFRRHPVQPLGTEAEQAITLERTAEARVVVPEVLEHPHEFVRKSKGALRRKALMAKEVRLERACLDVTVSRPHLDRALGIMNALLKALDDRGHKVFMTGPKSIPGYRDDRRQPSETGVFIGDVAVEFALEEVLETVRRGEPKPRGDDYAAWFDWRRRNPPPWYIHRPTGRLSLLLRTWNYGLRRSWKDGKTQKIEDMLNEFIASILTTAERTRVAREEAERRQREYAELRRRQEEEQRRRELESARRRDLEERVRKFEFAASVRRLIAAVRQRTGGTGEPITDVAAWTEWAAGVAAEVEHEAVSVPQPG